VFEGGSKEGGVVQNDVIRVRQICVDGWNPVVQFGEVFIEEKLNEENK